MDTEIKFRVASEDKARFTQAAERGHRKLSDWIRLACIESAVASETASMRVANPFKHVVPESLVLPKDPKEVAEAVRTIKSPAKRGTVEPKKLSEAVADTRTRQEKADDFYRANMAKGKK